MWFPARKLGDEFESEEVCEKHEFHVVSLNSVFSYYSETANNPFFQAPEFLSSGSFCSGLQLSLQNTSAGLMLVLIERIRKNRDPRTTK